jgi:hypothetical protein
MADPPEYDRRRIRIGLAILAVVVMAALVGASKVDGLARLVLLAIVLFVCFRMFFLRRAIRRDRGGR